MNTPLEVATIAARALDAKKAEKLSVLEVGDLTVMAEYFVICNGTSTTHLKTLSEAVQKALEDAGEKIDHIEGRNGGTWILLDFGCTVVHIFMEEVREFYSLDRLWSDAKKIEIEGLEA